MGEEPEQPDQPDDVDESKNINDPDHEDNSENSENLNNPNNSNRRDPPVDALPGDPSLIIDRELSKELEKSYIEYAMSVIIGRSIPDIRDGLKPVQRRILYSMKVNNFYYNRPYHKCATIVGHVLGHYHPHGDSSVYYALVRQAQDFSLRYPLIDGQGNFGSIDGDEPAAYRYTEARLQRITNELIDDLDLDTVDFMDNFDGSEQEPESLPAKIPNLLLNGSTGIAVGMATNIAPHNLIEICDAVLHGLDVGPANFNPEHAAMHIKGPDFPTGGIIMGISGIQKAIATGKGRVVIRSKTEIVPDGAGKGKDSIIVTEIPYAVKKADLIEEIADKVKKDVIPEIGDIRDESDRTGMRVVIELKHNSDANACLNRLYQRTRLQNSFSMKNLCLINKGRQPKVLNYAEMIREFIWYRESVIKRRSEFLLKKAEKRMEIVAGLLIAIINIDEIVQLIKRASSPNEASLQLETKYGLTELQSQEILKMRLSRLTSLQTQKLKDEEKQLKIEIEDLKDIIESKQRRYDIIREEIISIKEQYGDERRSEIVVLDEPLSIEFKETIPEEDCVILFTKNQNVKRMTLEEYNAQNRGGKGKIGAKIREDDFVEEMFVVSSHDELLLFTSQGRAYSLPAYKIPLSSRYSLGKAIVNFVELKPEETIVDFTSVNEFDEKRSIVLVTQKGTIKRTALDKFSNIRRTGIICQKVKENDNLVKAKLATLEDHVFIATKKGKAIHFEIGELREIGRSAMGVKGIEINDETNDEVVDMVVNPENVKIITFTKQGYGKKTKLEKYRLTHRAGKGVINIKLRNDKDVVIGVKSIEEESNLILASKNGVIIRIRSEDIRETGRAAQGVIVMRLSGDDEVSGVALCDDENGDIETVPIEDIGDLDEDDLDDELEDGDDELDEEDDDLEDYEKDKDPDLEEYDNND